MMIHPHPPVKGMRDVRRLSSLLSGKHMILYLSHTPLSSAKMTQIHGLSTTFNVTPCIIVPSEAIAMTQVKFPNAQVISMQKLDIENMLHEPVKLASTLADWIITRQFKALFAPHTPLWMHVISLLAAAFDVPYIGAMMTRSLPKIQRTICAGRLIETLDIPKTSFCATLADDETANIHSSLSISGYLGQGGDKSRLIVPTLAAFTSFEKDLIRLDGARLVFAGGRGLGCKAGFDKLAACAAKCGAALAASRLAVDLGWCRNDIQVGQTGLGIAPEIYVAFGISGAIQHVAGIKNARKIIAINTDKDAPIFNFADVGIIADAQEVIEQLNAQ